MLLVQTQQRKMSHKGQRVQGLGLGPNGPALCCPIMLWLFIREGGGGSDSFHCSRNSNTHKYSSSLRRLARISFFILKLLASMVFLEGQAGQQQSDVNGRGQRQTETSDRNIGLLIKRNS